MSCILARMPQQLGSAATDYSDLCLPMTALHYPGADEFAKHRPRQQLGTLELGVFSGTGRQRPAKLSSGSAVTNGKSTGPVNNAAGRKNGGSRDDSCLPLSAVRDRRATNLHSPTSPLSPASPLASGGSSSCDSSPDVNSIILSANSSLSAPISVVSREEQTTTAVRRANSVTCTVALTSSGHVSRSPLRSILRTSSDEKADINGGKTLRSRSAPNDRRKTASGDTKTETCRTSTRSVVFGDERGLPLVSVFHYQRHHSLRRYSSEPGPLSDATKLLQRTLAFEDSSDDEYLTYSSTSWSSSSTRAEATSVALAVSSNRSEAHLSPAPIRYYLDGAQPWSCADFCRRLEVNKVCLESVTVSEHGEVLGLVQVCNVAYHKSVKIRLTVDNWENCVEVIAKFTSSLGADVDRFTFTYMLPAVGLNLKRGLHNSPRSSFIIAQFAVRYAVDTTEYWDNNYTKNYRILRELAASSPP